MDPALDHDARQGHYNKVKPPRSDRRPDSESTQRSCPGNGRKPKAGNVSESGTVTKQLAAAKRTRAPQVNPLWASGTLAVNPPPKPTTVDKTQIESFLAKKWKNIPTEKPNTETPASTPSSTKASQPKLNIKTPASTQFFMQVPQPQGSCNMDVSSSSSSESESGDDDDEMTEVEQMVRNLTISAISVKTPSVEHAERVAVELTPQTSPETVISVPLTIPKSSVDSTTENLINDEPDATEVERLPEAIFRSEPISEETSRQAYLQPATRGDQLYHKVLQSQDAFEDFVYRRAHGSKREAAIHTPATNASQYVNEGFKVKGLESSKYAD